ncbi:MAG: hypothetical protein QOI40_224, partial [Alphaproteobacteria bacterium]|nr:hypothetical protein [Alphaproteobacteria bacterium]
MQAIVGELASRQAVAPLSIGQVLFGQILFDQVLFDQVLSWLGPSLFG